MYKISKVKYLRSYNIQSLSEDGTDLYLVFVPLVVFGKSEYVSFTLSLS